jgi:glycosyltransferase involved in cell wall biosynthesis
VLVRTSGPELTQAASAYPVLSLVASPLVRTVASRATAIIVKSPAELTLLHRSGVPGSILCIPNAVRTHAGPRSAESFRRPPGHRTVRLLAVARLEHGKGIRVLLGALELLGLSPPRHHLTIVGDGRQRSSLEGLAHRQRLPVTFLGKVPHDRLPAIYAGNDVLVLPSAHEGCSNAALEAMAAGLPVVGTPAVWSGLSGTGSPAGIVAPFGDQSALAASIAAVGVPATYRRLVAVGRQVAAAHSIDRLVDGYGQLLSKVLDDSRVGRRR